ncbi:MAG: DUF2508 family protein [Syntrophomonas sp.]|uniref:DUF2508 family protein n=1 Tax=Syntrophomonas sp. TaxID=2053627 RepID=UPI00260C9343|nr:DUF2508 family protein [Syntrophomonas sp.]MDD2511200.1 DUF2508 family protein [Syntrophomonas sp.]MDD3878646.1 DUF2508 family protein [Syntrophomonas sp.]MDD4627142.1 DUF2508 family protein [Syntrophomonas sp.]
MKICSTIWNWACKYLILKEEDGIKEEASLEEMLQEAHREVQEAENLFTRVEEEEMIDYAILNLQAAEKRYNYLLKTLKQDRKLETSREGL